MHPSALVATLALSLALLACENGSPSSQDSGPPGSAFPEEDGALCACATPDCLPNCGDLPPCKLECSQESSLDWVDSCGGLQYAQACPNGCADASTPHCL